MITVIGWRDPWSLQAFCMRERANLPWVLIQNGEVTHPQYGGKGWSAVTIAINHAKGIATEMGLEVVRAEIEAIDAHAGTAWQESEFAQVRVGIRTSPAAWLCWPPQTFAIQPGQIVLVPAGWQSTVNCGEQQAITLVLSLRMSDSEHTHTLAASGSEP